MHRMRALLFVLPLSCATLLAQGLTARSVQAIGSATISVTPDQVQIAIGVVTQGSTAQDAAQQNATDTTTVQNALKQVVGANGKIETIGYSVSPRFNNVQPPVIVGYTASNTVQVTSFDLSITGKLIDAANAAGANNVGGLTFGLRDPEPVKLQALSQAAKQAQAHAGAIASGLGAKTGVILSAQEGATVTPIFLTGAGATTIPTPIQTGAVSVSANVTISVQLMQ